MKKIILILVILAFIFLGIFILTDEENTRSIIDFDYYKDIENKTIEKIGIIKYTEAGVHTEIIDDKEEIKSIYKMLINIKIGEETNMACEDNTTVYVIQLEDETEISIEIECDWLVVGNKRYKIVH